MKNNFNVFDKNSAKNSKSFKNALKYLSDTEKFRKCRKIRKRVEEI